MTGGHGGWRTGGNHPDYSIVENGQNTEKSPGNLRGLAVTQNPEKKINTDVKNWVNNKNDNDDNNNNNNSHHLFACSYMVSSNW